MPEAPKIGAVIEIAHPFILEEYSGMDADGPFHGESWRPGIRYESISPEDTAGFADGVGQQAITVVSVHKPGRFPTRVFYTRQWTDPTGKKFGKNRLLIATLQKFDRICRGYRVPYAISDNRIAA